MILACTEMSVLSAEPEIFAKLQVCAVISVKSRACALISVKSLVYAVMSEKLLSAVVISTRLLLLDDEVFVAMAGRLGFRRKPCTETENALCSSLLDQIQECSLF